jgi:hypothetical protein
MLLFEVLRLFFFEIKNKLLSSPTSQTIIIKNIIDNEFNYSICFHKNSISLNLINISNFFFIEKKVIVIFQKNF